MVSRLFQVGSGFNDFETYRHALAGGFDVGYLACCRSKAGSVVLRLGSAFRTFNLFDFRKEKRFRVKRGTTCRNRRIMKLRLYTPMFNTNFGDFKDQLSSCTKWP